MENLGLNNDVSVAGRKFHVQTNYSDSEKRIVSNVFNEGQIVDSKEIVVDDDTPLAALKERMDGIHQELITEMEILYYISEKVKTVRHATSANKLGLLFMQKNLFDEACEQFRLALEIDPGYSEVYAHYGKALIMAQDYDSAVETLNKGAELAPAFADMQYLLGVANLYKEDFVNAAEHLQKATSLNPKYTEASFNLGIAMLAQCSRQAEPDAQDSAVDVENALRHIRAARERGLDGLIPNGKKILDLIDSGAYADAVDEYLLNKPKDLLTQLMNAESEFYLKFMYGGKGKDDSFIAEYVNDLQELIDANPNYADVRNNLGVANLIQCRNLFLKALDEFRSALKINPNFKKAEKNLKLAENDGKGFLILLRAILK